MVNSDSELLTQQSAHDLATCSEAADWLEIMTSLSELELIDSWVSLEFEV